MNKTEEQSGMTMEQMEEAGKIEEKKRDAEAAVAQSEAASKRDVRVRSISLLWWGEGDLHRVLAYQCDRGLTGTSGLVLAQLSKLDIGNGEDGFAEPLVEAPTPPLRCSSMKTI
ncbi:hypothetical protein PAPYR_12387 [Paratrimastix pyriformis]|uniref:Uncharacterized protein n=1 Tax=Paratrimastix pyriformis TaxID=342808 RepID=A0ABQ8U1Y0_9EUKA|nr:hypothetical protein PAPYR_12387 [Paratrimastix pyriformis]